MGDGRTTGGMSPTLARRSVLAGLCALGAAGAGIVTVEYGPLRRGGTATTAGGSGPSATGSVVLDVATPEVTGSAAEPDVDVSEGSSAEALRAAAPSGPPSASPSASPSAPASPAAASKAAPTTAIAAYLRTRPGGTSVVGVDLRTGRSLTYRPTARYITASIVKVEILAALLLRCQATGTSLTSRQRTLATAMITRSDNAAASSLWSTIGGGAGLARANATLGLTSTTPGPTTYWGNTRTTARDQVRLLTQLTSAKSPLSAANRSYVLELMEHVVAGQRWGVSAAASGEVALKDGWLATVTDHGLWTVNSIGRIERPDGSRLLMAVLSHGSPSLQTGITTVQKVAQLAGKGLLA